MKQSTRLTSAVFQLTPTRTRCDLIIIANDKKEKVASGLLNPFLVHLKTAQDQIAKGGYSILLEPESDGDAAWFTKATLERFVRFVSTPEILERVYTIETEILQIEEAIAIQSSNNLGKNIVENHQQKTLGGHEGDKILPDANEEKAIVIYEPGTSPPEANGPSLREGNSKFQLLQVLETRKAVLQKEQEMAFARAVAAGFDIDHLAPLVSFAECFGATRLMEACSRFMNLWKSKHEVGQWMDIEASEAFSTQSNVYAMSASGIILSDAPNNELTADNNGKSNSTTNADNPVPNGRQENIQRQFPHLLFPPWPMHAPPGSQPLFQAYPVPGMPHYHTYTGNGPFYQPHHYPMDHSPANFSPHSGQKRQSRDSNTGSEMLGRTRSLDDVAPDAEAPHRRKPRKRAGGSNEKQAGTVVIRNINYITSKDKRSGSETNSDSHSDIDTENEGDGNDMVHQNNTISSKGGGKHLKSMDDRNFDNDEVSILGKDTDTTHWQAFQVCLLRGSDTDAFADNGGMFAMEKDVKIKKHANAASDDPLALRAGDKGELQDNRMTDIRRISGSTSGRPRRSGDEVLSSRANNDLRRSNDLTDIQFSETNGRKNVFTTAQDDPMIGSQCNPANLRDPSDPLAVNRFEGACNKIGRDSSHGIADETLIVPFRSMSLDQVGATDRTAIDMDSENPSKYQKLESKGNKNKVNYEPNDLSLMPERGTDKMSIGYDLALDYEMQVRAEKPVGKGGKEVTNLKDGPRKSDKDRRSKVTSESLHRQRIGGPMRNGKSSKMSPLEDARARAEKLRSYKADLQKMKKEKEEAEAKRLESLKLARQKRIASRGGSTSVKPSTLSPQTKQSPAKLSAETNRGFKFTDSEPGSSSPLQRSKVRNSLGTIESHKATKDSKTTSEGGHMLGNRLTRSSSSLSERRRQNNGVTPESKASMSHIRRLSEPKTITNSPVTTMKARSAEVVLKRKMSERPETNKVSAIINLDRNRTSTLPELKIKTSKSRVTAGDNRAEMKDRQKVNGIRPSMSSENADVKVKDGKISSQFDADDNPIVEKSVVVLESEKPSRPLYSSQGKTKVFKQQHNNHNEGEKSSVMHDPASIHAPPSPVSRVGRENNTCQQQKQSNYEVRTTHSEKDPPNFANITAAEKPYHAPHARVSSLEDPYTRRTEYDKAPKASPELLSRTEETAKAHVPDVKALKMDNNKLISVKTSVKESSKGLRWLLKFGKKGRTSSSVDQTIESGCTSGDGIKHDNNARKVTSTNEVHTLKNLISQDETSTAGNAPQKTSRHFSLLSPFRSKTNEKKQVSKSFEVFG